MLSIKRGGRKERERGSGAIVHIPIDSKKNKRTPVHDDHENSPFNHRGRGGRKRKKKRREEKDPNYRPPYLLLDYRREMILSQIAGEEKRKKRQKTPSRRHTAAPMLRARWYRREMIQRNHSRQNPNLDRIEKKGGGERGGGRGVGLPDRPPPLICPHHHLIRAAPARPSMSTRDIRT